jgi:hypothetical protein
MCLLCAVCCVLMGFDTLRASYFILCVCLCTLCTSCLCDLCILCFLYALCAHCFAVLQCYEGVSKGYMVQAHVGVNESVSKTCGWYVLSIQLAGSLFAYQSVGYKTSKVGGGGGGGPLKPFYC